MKIAVESNDGINIASPNNLLKNFLVFEVGDKNDLLDHDNKLKLVRSIEKTKNFERELGNCSAVISHGLNRLLLNNLRRSGIDVYITFQNRIADALNQYFKDIIIHQFH